MRYLDVRLRLPDALLHPMQAFIRHGDAVEYEELLAWNLRPDEGVEYELFYVEGDLAAYREAVSAVETVEAFQLAPVGERAAHVWAREATRPEVASWRDALAGRRLVVVPPVRFDDDAVLEMTLVGEGEDLQATVADVPDPVDVTVLEVGRYDRYGGTLAGGLTDRQLEAVATARRLGYYEVPRGAELADVAAALGTAESTASVLLRRAERTVLSRVLERYGGERVDREAVAADGGG